MVEGGGEGMLAWWMGCRVWRELEQELQAGEVLKYVCC